MKILNFLPLLAWMLLFIPAMALTSRLTGETPTDSANAAATHVYLLGIVFWLVIAIVLSA